MNANAPDHSVSLTIGNAIPELEKIVTFVDRFGLDQRLSRTIAVDVNVCLDELLNNTISYGYDDQQRHEIIVTLRRTADWLTIEIKDDGRAFDPTAAAVTIPRATMQARKAGGLGIHFVRTLMDEVDYRREGRLNVLRLKKKIKEETGDGNG
jgi:serine/threonine-protein kinase RsbW